MGKAGSSPAIPWDAVLFPRLQLFPCGFPSSCPGAGGMLVAGGEKSAMHLPSVAFSPPPNSFCKVLSREQCQGRSLIRPRCCLWELPEIGLTLPSEDPNGKGRLAAPPDIWGAAVERHNAQSDNNSSKAAFTASFRSNYCKTR